MPDVFKGQQVTDLIQRMRAAVPDLKVIGGAIGRDANDQSTAFTQSNAVLYCKEDVYKSGAVGCLLKGNAQVFFDPFLSHSQSEILSLLKAQRTAYI